LTDRPGSSPGRFFIPVRPVIYSAGEDERYCAHEVKQMKKGIDRKRPTFALAVSIAAFVLLGAGSLIGEESHPWSFHSEFDLFLAPKAGAEFRVSDAVGIRGSIGACIISPTMISYTLVGVSRLRPPEKAFQCNLEYGLIQAVFDVLEQELDLNPQVDMPFTWWVPGACVSIGYRSPKGHEFSFRIGGGVLFGYDRGAWQKPGFQPNLAIEYDFRRP
jgi:hypothetical protein